MSLLTATARLAGRVQGVVVQMATRSCWLLPASGERVGERVKKMLYVKGGERGYVKEVVCEDLCDEGWGWGVGDDGGDVEGSLPAAAASVARAGEGWVTVKATYTD